MKKRLIIGILFLISCSQNIEKKEIIYRLDYKKLEKIKKQKIEKKWNKKHIKTPEKVGALYYSFYGINNEKKFNNLLKIAKNTSINSVIINIKEVDGIIHLEEYKNIFEKLQKEKIYKIARIVVFKDNLLTKKRPDLAYKWKNNKEKVWTDYAGNSYLDAGSKEVWDYNLNIAEKAYQMGFDEINFDYIRFPSDGKTSQIYSNFINKQLQEKKGKIKIINNFSKYISEKLKKKYPKIVLSADVFGLVTNGDLNTIGQNLEGFLENFDYVAPMTYPSHYVKGFLGFKNPDNHPYEIINDALKNSYTKIDKYNLDKNNFKKLEKKQIRLWLQGFSCTRCKGSTPYMDNKFKLQTNAITDNNANGFWVWNANSNYYESWYK